MKPITIAVLLASLCIGAVSAEEGELLLKMDLTKIENGNPVQWVNNPAVNKIEKVQLMKDADGSAYLKAGNNRNHYYYIDLFPVNENDRIIVTVKARGRAGVDFIRPGFYIFDRIGRWRGQALRNFSLKPEWQVLRAEFPLVNKPIKGEHPFAYTARVRPLIELYRNAEFKDYTIRVIRNPILKDWVVNMLASSGDVKAGKGSIVLPGTMEYTGLKLRNVKIGDKAEFTFIIRGKGKLKVGFYAYDLKYNPARKANKECGETVKLETIDSEEWKEVKISVNVENILKDGKTFYVNRIREFFRTAAQDGNSLELKKAAFQLSSETILVPDF